MGCCSSKDVEAEEYVPPAGTEEKALVKSDAAAAPDAVKAPPASEPLVQPVATFNTSMGTFEAEIYLNEMPITASNFISLVREGFYDGICFHRVISEFMIQFGCPYAREPNSKRAGTGGPPDGSSFVNLATGEVIKRTGSRHSTPGKGCIPDEHTLKITNDKATLAMANSGAGTGSSQFFINVEHNSDLDWFDTETDSQHPVFGKICKGFDVVLAISEAPADEEEVPQQRIEVHSITVAEGKGRSDLPGPVEVDSISLEDAPWEAVTGHKTTKRTRTQGSGTAMVKTGCTVVVHATGMVQETRKQFWCTKDEGEEPFEYEAGVGDVITGWDQGCLGMLQGEVRELVIPGDEAYGEEGFDDWGIGPNATLCFTLECLSIKAPG